MDKLLTIVIPSYNMEKYLNRCLSSLIVDDERMNLFEALVINDGSKDRTSEIAHQFETRYPGTFRTIDKQNGHYGSCVNKGIEEAKGTFIKILDADDAFDTPAFQDYLTFLSQDTVIKTADLILSDYAEVDEQQHVFHINHYSSASGPITLQDVSGKDKELWFIHGFTYRTENLRRIRYRQTERIAYTDHEWTFFPLIAVRTIYVFKTPLYLYTNGREGQSVSSRNHAKGLWMEAQVSKSLVSYEHRIRQSANPDILAFMQAILLADTEHLYQLYLVTYRNMVSSLEPLRKLDRFIHEENPWLYDALEHYSTLVAGFRIRPVYEWRHQKKFQMAFHRFLYSSVDFLNQLRRSK
ncbi:MAG: glycosyltransferase family 2 protein [Bacteroidales bacterium]|nr:glycosyltransferase family 2 protein [Bacteroidales bacterium]